MTGRATDGIKLSNPQNRLFQTFTYVLHIWKLVMIFLWLISHWCDLFPHLVIWVQDSLTEALSSSLPNAVLGSESFTACEPTSAAALCVVVLSLNISWFLCQVCEMILLQTIWVVSGTQFSKALHFCNSGHENGLLCFSLLLLFWTIWTPSALPQPHRCTGLLFSQTCAHPIAAYLPTLPISCFL